MVVDPLRETEAEPAQDLTPVVGANLKRLRIKRGLSLERLAKASGVSRAMLGQIELGQSTPTINIVWKIARSLAVPFSALISHCTRPRTAVMPAHNAKELRSADGAFSSRALFPFDEPRQVELYELRLAPRGVERAEAHPAGTTENLVVASGTSTCESTARASSCTPAMPRISRWTCRTSVTTPATARRCCTW